MHPLLYRCIISAAVPRRILLLAQLRGRIQWNEDRIRAYQEDKLRHMVAYCWAHVPFYRRHWAGHIDDPRDIRGIADLLKLPLLTKAHVRENLSTLTSSDPRVKSTAARTGGSTGQPVIFRMTHHDEQLAWAQMYLGWTWAGWRVGDPFIAVGGESVGVGSGDKRTRNDKLMNRWVSSGSNVTRERTAALAASPQFAKVRLIYGYPNSIRELGEQLAALGKRPPALRGIVCTAEVMRPEVRQRIVELYGVDRVLDQYGLNDGGLHACETADHDGLHLSFHRGVLEILDEQNRQIQALTQTGRAVATTLTNPAMPFVRYETGDNLHWHSREPAPSGVHWARIGPVDGRTGDVIRLPSGRAIPMPGLTLVMRWIDGLKSYQFIQTGPDTVTVRLDKGAGFTMTDAQVLDYLSQRIGAEVRWQLQWGAPELSPNGKLLIIRNDWQGTASAR
jgi:phenylacetate-CoA ligase